MPPDRRPPPEDKPPVEPKPEVKGCECGETKSCECDLTALKNELIVELTKVIQSQVPPTDKPDKQRHVVIVADQKAAYWPRLSGEIKVAEGYYSAIKTAPPPAFSVPLPQLVLYENGIPVRRSVGLYNVSNDLAQITRGTFPSESAGQ